MSAELPIFSWSGDRREFLRGAARLGKCAAGTIYLTPILSACENQTQSQTPDVQEPKKEPLVIPERKFSREWIHLINEPERKERDFLVGQIAEVRWDQQKHSQRVFISDILGGPQREINLPLELSINNSVVIVGRGLAFSPVRDKLAIWVRSGTDTNLENIFLVDTQNLSVRKIHEGPSDTEGGLVWSNDGKRLLSSSYSHAFPQLPFRGAVSIFEGDRIIYSEPRAIANRFSPDGKWVVITKGYTTPDGRPIRGELVSPYIPEMYLVNWDTKVRLRILFTGNLVWSKDSRLLAGAHTLMIPRGGGSTLRILDLSKYEDKVPVTESKLINYQPLLFSPDNQNLLFKALAPTSSEEILALLNIETQEIKEILRKPQGALWSGVTSFSFLSSDKLLIADQNLTTGDIEIKTLDLDTRSLSTQYSIKVEGPLLGGQFGLEQAIYRVHKGFSGVDLPGETQFFSYLRKDGKSTLLGRVKDDPPITNFDFWADSLKDEEVITNGNRYLFKNGRRYPIGGETLRILQSEPSETVGPQFIWPVEGEISSKFGGGHTGLDIVVPIGTPVRATASGRVTFAGPNYSGERDGYGEFIVISHPDGYRTRYGHLKQGSYRVKVGDQVLQGDIIAESGNTGNVKTRIPGGTGAHLHFEIKKDRSFLDPQKALEEVRGSVSRAQVKRIPSSAVQQIPESENKIGFRLGEMVADSRGELWYLQNGKRYRVSSSFMGNTRFAGKIWEMPEWVLQRIPIGEQTTQSEFPDWDGHQIENQRDGGLMALFCGGYRSSSESQREMFARVKELLKVIGWRDSQFLEFSYNVGTVKDQEGNIRTIRPFPYIPEQTLRSPIENVATARLMLEYYARTCPKTRLILVGHSLGGFLALEAALRHPQNVAQVFTINSPLTGIDRAIIPGFAGELTDFLPSLIENEPGEYFSTIGDDQSYKELTEENVKRVFQSRGIELFTFAAQNDRLVRSEKSILPSSNTNINGYNVQLLWHVPSDFEIDQVIKDFLQRGQISQAVQIFYQAHSSIFDYEPFLRELVKVIGRPTA